MDIDMPAHAVVIAIGGRRAPIAEALDRAPAVAAPWNVNEPDESAARLHNALRGGGAARVAMARAHPKAIVQAARVGRRHGADTILLRLPGAPDVDVALGSIAAAYDVADVDALTFRVTPMPSDRRDLKGPFDIVGDVHGAADEFEEMLTRLGHMVDGRVVRHAQGRTLVLLGDLTDRGPRNMRALDIAREAAQAGALMNEGNHDRKLRRWLEGREVRIAAGLAGTIAEIEANASDEWRAKTLAWLQDLQTHHVLDEGRLVVAHAGLDAKHHGRHTASAESFALYGRVVDGGRTLDADGHPLVDDWALAYDGDATVVHGHVVHPEPLVTAACGDGAGEVYAIDTGLVFGSTLTAFHWPERTYTTVAAHRVWFDRRDDAADEEGAVA